MPSPPGKTDMREPPPGEGEREREQERWASSEWLGQWTAREHRVLSTAKELLYQPFC